MGRLEPHTGAQATGLELAKRIGQEAGKLGAMLFESTPDAEKIGAAYQAIFDLQRQAIENAVNTYNKQVAVLDPEQLKKWNAMREQVMSRFFPAGPTQQTK
jgi:Spy/CpxP family protein refolding chaperone